MRKHEISYACELTRNQSVNNQRSTAFSPVPADSFNSSKYSLTSPLRFDNASSVRRVMMMMMMMMVHYW